MVAFQSANTDKTQSVLQQGTYPSFQNIPEYSHAFRRHVYHSFSFLSLFLSYYQAYLRPISSFSFFMSSCFSCLLPTLFSSFSVFYLLIFPFFCSPTLSHSSRFLSFTFLFFSTLVSTLSKCLLYFSSFQSSYAHVLSICHALCSTISNIMFFVITSHVTLLPRPTHLPSLPTLHSSHFLTASIYFRSSTR